MKNCGTQIPEKRRLIYILAPSYTGSTLLTLLLSNHKDISTIGELKATARGDLDTYLCSCGSLQRECNFWKRLTEEMQKAGARFDLNNFGTHFEAESILCDRLLCAGVRSRPFERARTLMLRFFPGCRNQLYGILDQNRRIIELVCSLQGGKMFLDGSKDPIRLKLLALANYWSLKVIYLIRDGRGATNSYMGHTGVSMEAAAREWRRTHAECDKVLRGFRENATLTIHYEDLCMKPRETLAKVYRFLGLETNGEAVRCDLRERHIMGNSMRLKSTDQIKLDERWKSALTPKDLKTFDRIAGKLNRLYGY
jgi:Sulfotransferase family